MFHALRLACSFDDAPGDAQTNSLWARLLVANARTHENKLDVVRGRVYIYRFISYDNSGNMEYVVQFFFKL